MIDLGTGAVEFDYREGDVAVITGAEGEIGCATVVVSAARARFAMVAGTKGVR